MASGLFDLRDFFMTLERWAFLDFILPFLLIFAILFAVLQKTKILGEERRNINLVVSLVIALTVVVPHMTGRYPAGYDPVQIINAALPSVSILVVAVVLLLLLIGVFAHDKVYLGLTMPGWIAFFSVVALVIIFGSAAGWWWSGVNVWLDGVFGSDALAAVIIIVVFGIIIAFITEGDKDKEAGTQFKKLGLDFKKLFEK